MNNFIEKNNIIEIITQLIDSLKIITHNKNELNKIEKDIVLDKLKNCYFQIIQESYLQEDIVDKIEEKNSNDFKQNIDNQKDNSHKLFEKVETDKKIKEIETDKEIKEIETDEEIKEREVDEEIKEIENIEKVEIPAPIEEPNLKEDLITFLPENEEEIQISTVVSDKKEETPAADEKSEKVIQQKSVTKQEVLFKEEAYIVTKKIEQKREVRSLNDLLFEQIEEKSVINKIQETKIDDLAKAISLNDKFLYIRELFKNQGEEFGKAIKTLNLCNNIDEAFAEMERLKKFYFWDSTSEAYLSFCDLIRRKFA